MNRCTFSTPPGSPLKRAPFVAGHILPLPVDAAGGLLSAPEQGAQDERNRKGISLIALTGETTV